MMSEQQDKPEMQAGAEQEPTPVETPVTPQQDLQAELDAALAKAAENWDQLLRVQADLENTRRRAAQDVEKAHKFGLEKFAQELLPVKDSLELGLAASTSDDEAVAKLREGMELTLKMLSSCMEKFGIKEVNPLGEPFNPEWHQAMTMQESAEHAHNTVMLVMQKGYLLNDRLMRPAMVVVSKAAASAPADTPSIDEQA
ncbi:MAG: nucleotide exchange factor GrpE [Chromatiales bacterium]|nr:nucleotide exchange factor GrpE [Chromatiales bacterium]